MAMREPEYDETGEWVPRSSLFRHYYLKARAKRMVQQAPTEYGARVAFCGYCQSAYLASDAVPNSPCHDTEPVLTYDLERLVDAATFAETFLEALQATDPEDLLRLLTGLGGLARASVAGNTGELPEAPSTAAGTDRPASEHVEAGPPLDASVDGVTEPPADPPPPAEPGAGDGLDDSPASKPRRASRSRQPKAEPAAVAS